MGLEAAAAAAPKAIEAAAPKAAEAAAPALAGGLAEGAAASAPLDLLSFGTAAGSAVPEAVGSIVPATGALASGLATEPAFAGSMIGAFAPGLDTSAAALGGLGGLSGSAGGALPITDISSAAMTPAQTVGGDFSALDNLSMGLSPSGGAVPTGAAAVAPSGVAPAGIGAGVAPGPLALDPTAAAGAAGGGSSAATSATPSLSSLLTPAGNAANAAGNIGGAAQGGLSGLLGSAEHSIMQNPLGTALAAGGLGYNILQGQKQSAAQEALAAQASQLNAQGQQLASYLLKGNLPPGLKTSLDQATAAAKARVRSNFASQGMPTDPAHNSALAQELQMIDTQAVVSAAQIGQQLLSAGQNASGLSANVYQALANLDQTQTQRIGQSVANLAAALSPSRGLTLKVG